jgi:hypothetical protein
VLWMASCSVAVMMNLLVRADSEATTSVLIGSGK